MSVSEDHVAHLVDELERLNHTRGELWDRLDDVNLDTRRGRARAARTERALRRVEQDLADIRDRILGRQPSWLPSRVPAGEML